MKFNFFLVALITAIAYLETITPSVSSPIDPDNSLSTQVEQTGNNYKITGGGKAGNNLFHSFREFSIPKGATAIFDHNGSIKNIFSRVTGNSISNIEGTLQAHGIANFFLINPNGIIFSSTASLDVSGSFVASTANSIKFADGTEFSTLNTSVSPVLTVSVPIGLQFGNNPGSIINRSVSLSPSSIRQGRRDLNAGLQIKPNNTLALVGGKIELDKGNLTAIGGRIELGSVGDNSFVQLNPINKGWQLGYEGVTNFLDTQLFNGSIIDASGARGSAQITGRNFSLTTGSQIFIVTTGSESSGDLTINASDAVEIIGQPISQPGSFLFVSASEGSGNGGHVTINTTRLTIKDGGFIDLNTFGQGQGGQLTINAEKLVEIGGDPNNSGFLTTSTNGPGDAGSITINTERMVISNGGQIFAITGSQGTGGIITIKASQSLEITGTGTVTRPSGIDEVSSSIYTTSGLEDFDIPGIGTAGDLNINTGQLIISDGAEISVGTYLGGQAGNLTINADSILLNQGQVLADSTSGSGGNILINASDLLALRNNSLISATAGTEQTGGNGGNINITTPFIIAVPNENSDITANAFSGTGGNIAINETAVFGIEFRNQPTDLSDITASSQFGQSGNVIFNRPEVDPQTGIVTLPSEVLDAENTVVQSCGSGGTLAGGEFVVTGRGGTPADPYEVPELNRELIDLGLSEEFSSPNASDIQPSSNSRVKTAPESIVEAQGWIRDSQGNVILTAQAELIATPNSPGLSSTHCQNSPK